MQVQVPLSQNGKTAEQLKQREASPACPLSTHPTQLWSQLQHKRLADPFEEKPKSQEVLHCPGDLLQDIWQVRLMFGENYQQLWQSVLDEFEQVAQGQSQLRIGTKRQSFRVSSMYTWPASAKVYSVKPRRPGVLSIGLVTFYRMIVIEAEQEIDAANTFVIIMFLLTGSTKQLFWQTRFVVTKQIVLTPLLRIT